MPKRLCVFIMIAVIILAASPLFARGQDIIRMNSDINVEKDMVVNDVVSIGGNVIVSGRVENNIVAVGGSVTLRERSYVGGEIVVVGGEVLKDQTAVANAKITQIYMPNFIPSITNFLKGKWVALWATISILALLGFLGLAVLLAALVPEHMGNVVTALEKSFITMFVWGLVWAVLIVPVAVLLAVSIVGIILIPLEILMAGIALIIGYIASAILIGRKILQSLKKTSHPFADIILGILILFFIGFVPVVGALMKIALLTAGFGAVLVTRFGTLKMR